MSRATALAHRARLASVLAIGAFGVHQLRYLAADGGASGQAAASEGHGYLAGALPVLVGLALAAVIATVLRARFGGGFDRRPAPHRALIYAAALLAVYSAQELAEGALAAGHPGGVDALIGNSGWIAVPLALAIGAIAALLIRGLEGIESVLSALIVPSTRPLAPRSQGSPRRAPARSRLLAPLAFGLARRPPPAVAASSH